MALTAGPMGGVVGYLLPAGVPSAPARVSPGCEARLDTPYTASVEEMQHTCYLLPADHRRGMLFSSPYLPHNLGNDAAPSEWRPMLRHCNGRFELPTGLPEFFCPLLEKEVIVETLCFVLVHCC